MEIVGEDDSTTSINTSSTLEFGRGTGFHANDPAVSRRHILFELPKDNPNSETRVRFQVVGKNPVWVFSNGARSVFRKSEKGEMRGGDSFCVAARKPILFKLKRSEEGEEESRGLEEEEVLGSVQSEVEGDLGFGSVDVKDIDPVKEFGFLVIGHEFDHYPKRKIRAIKEWDWFIEEQRVDSDIDEAAQRKRRSKGARRKKDEEYDEEWTGESEDDKEVIAKVRNAKRPRYTTRSKGSNKPVGSVGASKKSEQKTVSVNEDEEEEDVADGDEEKDDDTLGGFIVDEEVEEDEDDDAEEEEEFEEEDDD